MLVKIIHGNRDYAAFSFYSCFIIICLAKYQNINLSKYFCINVREKNLHACIVNIAYFVPY